MWVVWAAIPANRSDEKPPVGSLAGNHRWPCGSLMIIPNLIGRGAGKYLLGG